MMTELRIGSVDELKEQIEKAASELMAHSDSLYGVALVGVNSDAKLFCRYYGCADPIVLAAIVNGFGRIIKDFQGTMVMVDTTDETMQ